MPDRILAIDVGAGTQDVLLWEAGQPMENNVQLILPSWTTILARQVRQATQEGRPVFLTGNLMGGGPLVSAMKRHLKAGYPVYATPRAALTIRDSLDQVREPLLAASLKMNSGSIWEELEARIADLGQIFSRSEKIFLFMAMSSLAASITKSASLNCE